MPNYRHHYHASQYIIDPDTGLPVELAGQPLDSDLTAIAALTTTSFGRSLLTQANAGAALTTLGVSAFIQTLLDDADATTARATLGVSAGATPEVNAAGRLYAAANFR